MQNDEQEIRQLVATWMTASKAGDVDTVLSLITEDVVFLQPGQPVMRKADFAEQSKKQVGPNAPTIDGNSETQEIQICGEWAFMWAKLSVSITPPGSAKPMKRSGHTLTIFRKQNGQWKLARDANLLVPVD
jgi:uncharacterized protein (TIGR02246 family)